MACKFPTSVEVADARRVRSAKSLWAFIRRQFGNDPSITTLVYLISSLGKKRTARFLGQTVTEWADVLSQFKDGRKALAAYANRLSAILGYTEGNPEASWHSAATQNARIKFYIEKLMEGRMK